jgi:hypothetical protein
LKQRGGEREQDEEGDDAGAGERRLVALETHPRELTRRTPDDLPVGRGQMGLDRGSDLDRRTSHAVSDGLGAGR